MTEDLRDEELDRRLRAAGEAWRDEHQPVRVHVPGPRRRAWVVPVAAAASVALLVGGAVVASRLTADRAAGPADTTQKRWDPDLPPGLLPAEVPGTVPPVNQVVEFPRVEAAGTYTPRVWQAAGVRECSADDVSLTPEAGEVPGAVRLVLAAAADDVRCSVGWLPFLQYRGDGRNVEVPTAQQDPRPGEWPASVVVAADQRAVVETSWIGWCGGQDQPVDTLELTFTDNTQLRVAAPDAVPCPATDFADDELHLTGWAPEGFTFEKRDSFGPISARLVDTVTGPRGLPTWVVELTAAKDVDLDTCPSYEVRQGSEESASWRLNCDGVPHHREDGRPYLPAGTPVRFAIWVPYGGTDAALTWRLQTPSGAIAVPLTGGPDAPTGDPRRVVERDANLHLYVAVGFGEPVRLTMSIDGTQVVDDSFESQGQDAPTAVQLAVPAGSHRVVVTSDTGARRELTLDVPASGDQWAQLEVWDDPDADGNGSIEWTVQGSPMMFG